MATRREREKGERRRTSAQDWAKQQERGFEPTAVKPPEGFKFFKFEKAGKYRLDIVPYVAGKGNPRADEGMEHFEREYEDHRLPTPDGSRTYCCAWKAFRKKCAVCDYVVKHGRDLSKELYTEIRGKTRHLFNVVDLDNKDEGVQVMIANHFNRGLGFGEQLAEVIGTLDEDASPFALKGGYTLHCVVKEQPMGEGKTYLAVTRMDLRPRAKDYPPDFIDKAACLDDCLINPDYKELERLLNKEDVEEKEVKDEEDEDEDEDKEAGKSKANGRAKAPVKGKPAAVEDEEDDEEDEEDEDSSDLEDEDEDDSDLEEEVAAKPPVKKPAAKTPAKKAVIEDDEDEDSSDLEDEDDEDEAPPKARGGRRK